MGGETARGREGPAGGRAGRPRRLLGAVTLALAVMTLAAGCSAAPSGRPGPQPSTSTPAAPALAAAQALVFANRYEEAQRAYARLAATSADPLVHAAYALFLTYRQDYAAALAEARLAVARGPRSGRAEAVLCRAEDWSTQVPAAVAAGTRAVALAPADVLAHLFLSEALADQGNATAAQQQIDRASALLGPGTSAYERAELHREQGNLARDGGDVAAELRADQAAAAAQPGWVERSTDLASAYLDAHDLAGAHRVLAGALPLVPADAGLLALLGQVALLQQDFATAEQVDDRLLALDPRDPTALEAAAEVAMARHRDSRTARQLLLRALAADPRDTAAVAYILALAREVDGDPAAARAEIADVVATAEGAGGDRVRPVDVPDPDAAAAAHAATALAAVNRARVASGLPAAVLDPRLSRSAGAHCLYWLFNNALPAVAGLGIHLETPGTPGFTGVRAGDRDAAAGWSVGPVGEDITHRGGPEAAVADWVDSVYHRFPIVRPDVQAIGYADCSIGSLPMEDMEFGFTALAAGPPAAPVVVPGDGQRDVVTTFVDNELPDPLPTGAARTAGTPVTVTFDRDSSVRLLAFRLSDPTGAEVAGFELSPSPATENSASLLPAAPLHPATRYTASISATVDGRPYQRTWSFVTA